MIEVIEWDVDVQTYLSQKGYNRPTDVVLDCSLLPLRTQEIISRKYYEVRDFVTSHLSQISGSPDTAYRSVSLINYNLNHVDIGDLRNSHIGKTVTFDCVVKKTSNTMEKIFVAAYECSICKSRLPKFRVNGDDISVPPSIHCPVGDNHKKFRLLPERCVFRDVQFVTVQEPTSKKGRQPKSIPCIVSGVDVDVLSPGMRCTLTGVVCVKMNQNDPTLASLYIEVCGIDKDSDDAELVITEEDIKHINEVAHDPNVYSMLADSLAPSIWGYNEIKLSLILQMFGGVSIETSERRFRGDAHILLCGDPSLAKTQLIRSVYQVAPRAVYASGKGTSAAGLTAAAVQDTDGRWTLEAGAMVLSDGGMCVIDELDKMSPADRSGFHEGMESQTITIHKAGLSETLNTRCSVLAAANPKSGRYIAGVPLLEQIDLPPSLMSRFDLIFNMVDVPDEKTDKLIASFILDSKTSAHAGGAGRTIPLDLLRKYIIYAKDTKPILTSEAKSFLEETYSSLRSDPNSYITSRQLEALVRLSEAAARVQLEPEATMFHAKVAVELFTASMNSITLGKGIDVSFIDSSATNTECRVREMFIKKLKDAEMQGINQMSVSELSGACCMSMNVGPELINSELIHMVESGLINFDRGYVSLRPFNRAA